MTDEQKLKRIKAQIHRLRESADRLEAFTALLIDGAAVRDECTFAKQVIYAIEQLAL
jgi:hypothetical protein